MTPTELSNPIYSDEAKALAHFEMIRWPQGPICFHCGTAGDKVRALNGKSMGAGWYYCENCKDKFTARMGTVLERSHVPVHKWLLAMRLMASSKKGISAHQLHRTLKVTYKTAWFLAHRIREAMGDDGSTGPLGGEGKVVEADETMIGPRDDLNAIRRIRNNFAHNLDVRDFDHADIQQDCDNLFGPKYHVWSASKGKPEVSARRKRYLDTAAHLTARFDMEAKHVRRPPPAAVRTYETAPESLKKKRAPA